MPIDYFNMDSRRPRVDSLDGEKCTARDANVFAAITARRFHPRGVDVLMGDGSVAFWKDSITWATWRALGTVNGAEMISADKF